MHHLCRKTLTRVAVTSWPSRSSGCGSAKCHRGQCTGPSRNFARVTNLDTSMEQHPQPCARIQSHTTGAGYQSNLSPQVNDTVTGARRDMDMPSIPDILAHYDWRTFAPPNAQLHYIRSEDVTNQRLARLVSRPGPFTIGLDFEWRPTFVARQAENPISLVQVACDDEILLVQVSAMEGFPTSLRNLLESGESTKVGVGIQYDAKKLWKDHRVSIRNCVDLALLARSVDTRWKGPYKGGIGLSRLAEIYLKRRLPKGSIQRSNWEMELCTVQQEYAANDSHAGLTVYGILEQRALELDPAPEREWFAFDAIKGVLRDDEGRPWFPFNPKYDPGPPPSSVDSGQGTALTTGSLSPKIDR